MTEPFSDDALHAIEHRLRAVSTIAPPPWRPWLETRQGIGGSSFVQFDGDPDVDCEMYLTVELGPEQLRSPDPRLDLIVDFLGNAAGDIEQLIAEVRRLRDAASR